MGLAEVTDITDIADILQTYCRHIADILQTYYRYIIDILPQIAADCGKLQWKTADCDKKCHGIYPMILWVDLWYYS